jgi:hypothetical protein
MVLIYAAPLQPRRGDKVKALKRGFATFFAPRDEIKQFQCNAKNCPIYIKNVKLERLADSGVDLYNIESKAA